MIRKEWSLIVNSLMVQLAAGMYTCLAVYRVILEQQIGREAAITLTDPGMVMAGPILLFGMVASLFHLGNPARAYRSVTNIWTSWLSREIFFTGVFFVLWFVTHVMGINGHNHFLMTFLTVVAGLSAVVSMASIYYSTGKPGWASQNTYTDFLGTTVIFGIVSATVILYTRGAALEYSKNGLLIAPAILAVFILLIRCMEQINLMPSLTIDDNVLSLDNLVSAEPMAKKSAGMYKSLTLWGMTCSSIGICLVLFMLIAGHLIRGGLIIIVSALVVFMGEFLVRSGFYSLGQNENK
ncbi:MAG: dimethyl sulfoxide reductase anchor subunit [Proteobacteria bacterium]|nr:dimethyl sulfoxide reductase anchor subunit [Pseudomonadota bacterium]